MTFNIVTNKTPLNPRTCSSHPVFDLGVLTVVSE